MIIRGGPFTIEQRDAIPDNGMRHELLDGCSWHPRSTALIDLNRKKAILEEAGCPSYRVIDPVGPTLTAGDLTDGAYVEVAQVASEGSWTAIVPSRSRSGPLI